MLLKKRAQRLFFSIAMLSLSQLAWSVPDASDYKRDPVDSFVIDRLFGVKKTANKILCLISQLSTEAMAGKGFYSVIFDPSSCDVNRPGDEAVGSFFEVAEKSYMRGVVLSDKKGSEYDVKAWIFYPKPLNAGIMAFEDHLYISAQLKEAPTTLKPLGTIRLDYCLEPVAHTDLCVEGGYVDSLGTDQTFYTFFLNTPNPATINVSSMREVDSHPYMGYGTTEQGVYRIQQDQLAATRRDEFDFDSEHVKMHNTLGGAGIADICYDRNISRTPSFPYNTRMGLYTTDTGSRIVKHFADYLTYQEGQNNYTGVMDSDGAWFPNVLVLSPQGNVSIRGKSGVFHLIHRPGFLSRRHIFVSPLDNINGLDTYLWIDPSNVLDPQTLTRILPAGLQAGFYSLVWDANAKVFNLTYLDTAQHGAPVTVPLSLEKLYRMWILTGWIPTSYGSNNLFTSLAITAHDGTLLTPDQVQVEQNHLDLVYLDDPIFTQPQTLYCIHHCPTIAAIRAGTYFDPATMNPAGSPAAALHQYTLANGVLTDMSGNPMVLPDTAQAGSQFATGPLLTKDQLDHMDSRCTYPSGFQYQPAVGYCVSELNLVQNAFIWETGTEFWNQYVGLEDEQHAIVHIDDPRYFTYLVPVHPASAMSGDRVILRQSRDTVLSSPVRCLNLDTNEPTVCTNATVPLALYDYYEIPFSEGPEGRLQTEDGQQSVLYKALRQGRIFGNVPVAECKVTMHPIVQQPTYADWMNPSSGTHAIGDWKDPSLFPVRVIDGEVVN